MTDAETRFTRFAALHRPGEPVVLYNVWDAGSAQAVAAAGAPAIATGSWSVAAAHGFSDAEGLPLDLALANAKRIVGAVQVPVTVDFEGGYAVDPDAIALNVGRLVATGAVGCNFEDQVVGGMGLHAIGLQHERIAAARDAAGLAFFINARTDVFLKAKPETHRQQVTEVVERAHAYAEAGASGLFIPGPTDADVIGRVCEATDLPVNVMWTAALPKREELAALGVARISYGPGPYRQAMAALTEAAKRAYG